MRKASTVSVVMATYNGEKYIREQIDSILNQSYPVHEVIIQDDCSTDSTPQICREYEAKHDNVHFYQNEHNLGFNENFRTAALRATGDFIAISDQDDIWFPQKIERQIATIGKHDICTCTIRRGEDLEKAKDEPDSNDTRPGTHIFRCLLGHSILANSSFIKDEYNWEGRLNYDWNLTLHADWHNGIVKIENVLLLHRSHNTSVTYKTMLSAKPKSEIKPYLYGLRYFRQLQNMPKFTEHCQYICTHTKGNRNRSIKLQHKMAELMLSHSFLDYLRLCLLCMKRRKDIYFPKHKAYGLKGLVRGFFYPALSAYYSAFNFV